LKILPLDHHVTAEKSLYKLQSQAC